MSRFLPRRGGADLDETEAQAEQRVHVCTVLVQARGTANGIGELDPEGTRFQRRGLARHQGIQARAVGRLDRLQAKPMRVLGVNPEQELPGEGIHRAWLS